MIINTQSNKNELSQRNCAMFYIITLRASCGAVLQSVLSVGVCVCGWVCYHDNSKLRASILTKLGF